MESRVENHSDAQHGGILRDDAITQPCGYQTASPRVDHLPRYILDFTGAIHKGKLLGGGKNCYAMHTFLSLLTEFAKTHVHFM
jgi:hypothetical protein